MHVSGNISKDKNVALQEMDYDVISVKQMTAQRITPEEGVTHY
jgi:hypothetical protein